MSVFVDTNVLLRAADPGDPKHEAATRTISELLETGETLCITPQIAAEPESIEVYSEWKRLVAEHKVQGPNHHLQRR